MKKNWSVSVRSFFFFRGSTSLSGSHSPVNLSYVHICVCVLTVCTVFLHIQKTFVWVRVQAVSLRSCMRVLVFPLTVRARMCVCLIHGIVDTLRCVLCCGVRMCMYASYTYCVYSRTFFLNYVRHTKRNAKFYILLSYEIHARCERIDWAGCLVGLDGR